MHVISKSCSVIAFIMLLIVTITPICNVVASTKGIKYLIRYGYLPKTPDSNKLVSTRSALISFQTQFGLSPTGVFDHSTINLMSRRRCGISNNPESGFLQNRDGFQLHGTKWDKRKLTYEILSYTNQYSQEQVDN